MPMAVFLVANAFWGDIAYAVDIVCYRIRMNHKAYLSFAKAIDVG